MKLLAANNAQTILASGINASATSLTVSSGAASLFPTPVSGTSFFKLTLIDAATESLTEIMHVTAVSSDTFTVVRGQEGTTARTWSVNDIVANMVTAGTLSYFAQLDSPAFTGTPTAPTATAGTATTQIASTAFVTTAIANIAGRFLRRVTITNSGTYTPGSDAKSILIECVGGGAGGGGCVATTATTAHLVSGGGGAGGTAQHYITNLSSSYICSIGTAGAGGSGSNLGVNGGTTSFSNSSTVLCSASGGTGGGAGVSGAISNSNAVVASGGYAGVGITGNLNTGSYESAGVAVAAFGSNIGSGGGSTIYGSGGYRVGVSVQGYMSGNNATGYGCGGGGCVAYSASAVTPALTGGSGSPGIIIVWEFG